MGVVPLGTGNDLARVLGWGSQFSDEDKIPSLLSEMEGSRVQLLDRWSLGYTKDINFNMTSLVRYACTCMYVHVHVCTCMYMYVLLN